MRWLARGVLLLVLLFVGALLTGWLLLRGSLPRLNGQGALPGLHAVVSVERDAAGVPTVHADDREDLMRALGYLHAQDRFFQMDTLRRQGAGELAELFGSAAVEIDKESRQHRFRRQAREVVRQLPPDKAALARAYTAGVNAGLASLPVRPWEYLLLRAKPRPWEAEDSVLVVDAMVIALQDHGADERARLAVLDVYGPEALAFLRPLVTERTAALDGSFLPAPPVPDAGQLHVRSSLEGRGDAALAVAPALSAGDEVDARPGSNNFALAGARVSGGGALVANDPHLGLRVPNIWYRAALRWPGGEGTGVTLPGVPALVLGSNGHVAWAFTNGQVDTSDVVIVERDPADPARYRVPDGTGWEAFETVHESIAVAHGPPVRYDHRWTRWGPVVVDRDAAGRTLALRWSEYDPACVNLALIDLLDARTTEDALAVAHRGGQHTQNFVVGDRAGHIAWTILGRVPHRIGFDGALPASLADGARRWDGYLPEGEVPTVRDPADGQLWTANNRVLGGDALGLLGHGGYSDPARAGQIRDRLSALAGRPVTAADGLAVQLDDEARFLFRWRDLLLGILTDDAVRMQPALEMPREVARGWNGHATPDQAGFRLVREFRRTVIERVFGPIYAPVKAREPMADYGFNLEQPLWSIVSARPTHLLPPGVATWDALLLDAVVQTAKAGDKPPDGTGLRGMLWGEANVLRMRHPLSGALPPFAARWLDMPAQALPGDNHMPRVQRPSFGASMRMVVVPGREAEGVFEQPGGASGHFLSPFYRAGHADWAEGKPSPFLPGPAVYRATLTP